MSSSRSLLQGSHAVLWLALSAGVLLGFVLGRSFPARVTHAPLSTCSSGAAPATARSFSAPLVAAPTRTASPVRLAPRDDELALAEFVYQNQAEQERGKTGNPLIASYEAQWPCFWGARATGLLKTWQQEWNTYKDGWKFTCGLALIANPCVVYSLGSSGNMAFEAGVLEAQPECEIHVFDKDAFGLEKWFPAAAARQKVRFHRFFISDKDDLKADPPARELASIMRELSHTHIDVLKMDIEGAELRTLRNQPLPSIGQLLVEVHLRNVPEAAKVYNELFVAVEKTGLRLFNKEVNARYDTSCVELSFIQKDWSPERKSYK